MARIAWLAGVATALGIPVLVTEEDPVRNGPTAPEILARVPASTTAIVKPVFGLSDTPEILAAVEALGRRTVALAGFETDVCVTHSALGLLDRGYRVAVVTDATGSPGEMHELGLRRMRDAGATLVHAKGVYYEWVRTVEAARAFEAANPDLTDPPGFSL
ncbi:MAG: isochorismatase family protein [Chloroflexota bacterium]|nr:isochorismatase family protein [Chloroflexota bacterium]